MANQYWQLNNTSNLSPVNDSYNLLVGGTASGSADIQLLTDGSAIFNEAGNSVDFRVEGDTNANLLFADGSTDRVGIGTNTPGSYFRC